MAELTRQVKELDRSNKDLEKLLVEEERKTKKKDMMIKTFDSENQALQLQVRVLNTCNDRNCCGPSEISCKMCNIYAIL